MKFERNGSVMRLGVNMEADVKKLFGKQCDDLRLLVWRGITTVFAIHAV
jgi:hypothetical protein